ncbi:MAG: hypothetical protein M3315_16230, partial [Actinomycetota bacterium]|nr:hypothetical protein [Actinomycetota bacterium]
PNEHRRFVSQKLVKVIGHRVFISASLNRASRARALRLSYTNAAIRQSERYEERGVDRQPPGASPFELLGFRCLTRRGSGVFELEDDLRARI